MHGPLLDCINVQAQGLQPLGFFVEPRRCSASCTRAATVSVADFAS